MKRDRRAVGFTSHGRWGKLPMLLASVLVLALGIAVSFALAAKHVESFFGEPGSAEGQFNTPRDVAVYNGTGGNPGSGDIYVVDDANHRIQQFDSNKAFVRTWGGGVDDETPVGQTCTAGCHVGIAGTTDGMFDNPQGIAVNQATGDVYVAIATTAASSSSAPAAASSARGAPLALGPVSSPPAARQAMESQLPPVVGTSL